LPLYSHVGRASVWQALAWPRYGVPVFILLVLVGLLALIGPVPAGARPRKALALMGALYGWLHYALQGKGWEYHLYPLVLFLSALAPFALTSLGALGRSSSMLVRRRRAALVVVAAAVLTLWAKGVDALDVPWIAEKARRVAAITRDLGPLAPAGATAQVMDVTEGGIHALLRLGLRPPTP